MNGRMTVLVSLALLLGGEMLWAADTTALGFCAGRSAGEAPTSGDTAGGVVGSRGELAMLRRLPPEMIARLRGGRPDARGYVGYQQTAKEFCAGHQRGGTYTLAMGVVLRRPEWIEEGWRVIDVTFAHQNADGSLGDPVQDQATSVAFFLCFCSRALGLLQASEYADAQRGRIEALLPKVHRACRWLATQTAALDKANAHAPNRCFIIADAFALTNALTPDSEAQRLATRYVDLGLKSYRASDGVFLEKGGGDSSYQAVSILVLMYYRVHVAEPRLDEILSKAVEWELTKVRPSGEVDVQGNTRTGLKQEKWQGHYKDVNIPEVIQALAYYGLWRPDDRALDAAVRIWKNYDPAKQNH
jgi:hypothetical protein